MGVRIRILIVAVAFLLVIWKSERALLITESESELEQQNIKRNPPVKVYAPSNSTSNVAICVILKNETLYLDEWIDFNIALGFSPIYMYDNSLAFDLMSMPLPNSIYSWYETREEIHEHIKLMHYPIAGVQEKAYERCIKEDAANSTYVALIDVDEFLVLKTFDNVVDFMDHHCSELECGELSINWKMMGTGGEKHYTPLPITKRNVHGQKYGTIKVIVRPSYVADNLNWWHSVALKRGYMVDTRGNKRIANGKGGYLNRQANDDGPFDVAVLHHYAFKSTDELHYKLCKRGFDMEVDGTSITPFCNSNYYGINETLQEFDDMAWRQLVRMVPKYRIYDA